MTDPLDDLLGGQPEPKPAANPLADAHERLKRNRFMKGKQFDEPDKIDVEALPHETEFMRPVGITFLAKIVKKQPNQIKKKLAKCPVIGWHKTAGKTDGEQPLYDFLTAMGHLIPPRGSIEDWFSQQNAASLPPYVNKMFWDSAHQRNRVMRSSGQLWHDDDVMIVLGRVAMTIRQEVKMWIEELPEKELLNDAQYNSLVDATNRLLDDVRKQLIENPKELTTLSMAHTIKDELEAAGGMPQDGNE
jgi:hypothetical protein